MIGTLVLDAEGNIAAPPSEYKPPENVQALTLKVRQDYQIGYAIQHKSFREFNDRSVLQEMEYGQKLFNAYIPPRSQDPDESWKANVVRPVVRNKIGAIAAHVTASLLYPSVFAQSEDDDEDKDAADVMRSLIEWVVRNSDYEETFLFAVIGALVNPVIYLKAEFAEGFTKTKKLEGKNVVSAEVLDDVISGFQTQIVPVDELFIANAYEYEIQRQRFLIRRRWIDFDEAKALWGAHANFKFVEPGVHVTFAETTQTFYRLFDTEHPTLVEEVTYYNRREDMEVPFLNGVYVGAANLEANFLRHRDTQGKPRYPFVKSGYEPIDEKRFFFYRSCAVKLGPEQDLVDVMYRMVLDGTFLAVMKPLVVSGGDGVDSSVVFPGGVTNLGKDATITPINVGELAPAWNAIRKIEDSMSLSAVSGISQGVPEGPQKTAYEIRRLEINAQTTLGSFGKMVGNLVVDFGYLMVDDIIQHLTVGEAMEDLGGGVRLKFPTFLLPNATAEGQQVTKIVRFSGDLLGSRVSPEEKANHGYRLLKEEGGLDAKKRIYEVNPEVFRRLKYLVYFEPEQLMPRSEVFEKAFKLEGYDRGIGNPFIDQESWTRDFLVNVFAKGREDKYMTKQAQMPMAAPVSPPGGTPAKPASAIQKNVLQKETLSSLPS